MWTLNTPGQPPLTYSGVVVSVPVSDLVKGATYTATLDVSDDKDVSDSASTTFTVPPTCQNAATGSPVDSPPPPPPKTLLTPLSPSPPPPSPPPPPVFVTTVFTEVGSVVMLQCHGDVTLDAAPYASNVLGVDLSQPVSYSWRLETADGKALFQAKGQGKSTLTLYADTIAHTRSVVRVGWQGGAAGKEGGWGVCRQLARSHSLVGEWRVVGGVQYSVAWWRDVVFAPPGSPLAGLWRGQVCRAQRCAAADGSHSQVQLQCT